MKATNLVFVIWILLLLLRIFGVYQTKTFILIGIFILWAVATYWRIHRDNIKDRTPRPVYLTSPS